MSDNETKEESVITEFGSITPDEKQSGFSLITGFLRRAFGFGSSEKKPDHPDPNSTENLDGEQPEDTSCSKRSNTVMADKNEDIIHHERTFSYVLSRIKIIIDNQEVIPGPYNEDEFRKQWLPDHLSPLCYDCSHRFTPLRRKHHCRICGLIFCSKCSGTMVPGKILGYTGIFRTCTFCCKVIFSYLQSSNVSADILADLHNLQDTLLPSQSRVDLSEYSLPKVQSKTLPNQTSFRRGHVFGFTEEYYAARFSFSQAPPLDQRQSDLISLERSILLRESHQLDSLYSLMFGSTSGGLPLGTHRHRLKTFPLSFVGRDMTNWLIANDRASSRQAAIAIGHALTEAGYLISVSQQEQVFVDDFVIYKPAKKLDNAVFQSGNRTDAEEPLWVKEIDRLGEGCEAAPSSESSGHVYSSTEGRDTNSVSNSNFVLDLNLDEKIVSMKIPEYRPDVCTTSISSALNQTLYRGKSANTSSMTEEAIQALRGQESPQIEPSVSEWLKEQNQSSSETDDGATKVDEQTPTIILLKRLQDKYLSHERHLLIQLLTRSGLSLSWKDVILPIIYKISEIVHPDVKNSGDDMDIRQYVQFKKVPSGLKTDSVIVNGTVCTKNIAHKEMRSSISDPQILLIASSIDFGECSGTPKMLGLHSVLAQEEDYLKNIVEKITSYKPDIVMVEKGTAFLAREYLNNNGITLAVNVKSSVMERIARSTQAEIIPSIEGQYYTPNLGMCHSFYLKTYKLKSKAKDHVLPKPNSSKTLMFFDGCATHLGCTVILRGASNKELKKVKQIMYFLIYSLYNWKLERSLYLDECLLLLFGHGEKYKNNESTEGKKDTEAASSKNDNIASSSDEEDCLGRIATSTPRKANVLPDISEIEELEEQVTGLKPPMESDIHAKSPSNISSLDTSSLLKNSSNSRSFNDEISVDNVIDSVPCHSTPDKKKRKTKSLKDFDDPLHDFDDYFWKENYIFTQNILEDSIESTDDFQNALNDTILSASPFFKFKIPYLETEAGRLSSFRKYFPDQLYHSALFEKCNETREKHGMNLDIDVSQQGTNKRVIAVQQNPHNFTRLKIVKDISSNSVQSVLSDYRARGGNWKAVCHCEQEDEELAYSDSDDEQIKVILIDKEKSTAPKENFNSYVFTKEGNLDVLHPYNHKRISILFSTFSNAFRITPTFCVPPSVIIMDFYGLNDISLGAYLEKYCFSPKYLCASRMCGASGIDHVRKFVHGGDCIEVLLRKVEKKIGKETPSQILMWKWCKFCKTTTSVIPMSSLTWSLSFAKFLELLFHERLLTREGFEDGCDHSIHRDHFHYFHQGNVVAVLKYTQLGRREIALPPSEIPYEVSVEPLSTLIETIKSIAMNGYSIFMSMKEILNSFTKEVGSRFDPLIESIVQHHNQQHLMFKEAIDSIQIQLTSPILAGYFARAKSGAVGLEVGSEGANLLFCIIDQITMIKKMLIKIPQEWNSRVETLIQLKKKEFKMEKSKSSLNFMNTSLISTESVSSKPSKTIQQKSPQSALPEISVSGNKNSKEKIFDSDDAQTESSKCLDGAGSALDLGKECAEIQLTADGDKSPSARPKTLISEEMKRTKRESLSPSSERSPIKVSQDVKNSPRLSASSPIKYDDVIDLESLLEERDQVLLALDHLASCGPVALRTTSSEAIHSTSAVDLLSLSQGGSGDHFSSLGTEKDVSGGIQVIDPSLAEEARRKENMEAEYETGIFGSPLRSTSGEKKIEEVVDVAQEATEKLSSSEKKYGKVMKNMISNFWSSSEELVVKCPFPASMHHNLLPEVQIPIVVYDEEVSSIIAHALASKEYAIKMMDLRKKIVDGSDAHKIKKANPNGNTCDVGSKSEKKLKMNSPPLPPPSSAEDEEFLILKNEEMHVEMQWSDQHAQFYCKRNLQHQKKISIVMFSPRKEI